MFSLHPFVILLLEQWVRIDLTFHWNGLLPIDMLDYTVHLFPVAEDTEARNRQNLVSDVRLLFLFYALVWLVSLQLNLVIITVSCVDAELSQKNAN